MDADREKLAELIATMDLPEGNRDLTSFRNVMWLTRNMVIRNGDHPNFDEASVVLKRVVRRMLARMEDNHEG